MFLDIIKAWYQASRAPFFIATLIPLSLGGILAWKDQGWDMTIWLIILTASFFVHLNTNLANDYFEYFSGADDKESIGGSRVLQEGKISLSQIKYVMIVLYSIAFLLGLWILVATKVWWLIIIMFFSFFSSLFYTAPPIRYGYHGFGELLVGINMGPVMVVGTYTALTGYLSLNAIAIAIPIGFLVAMILFYQSLSDIETDKRTGKNTLAAQIGRNRSILVFKVFVLTVLSAMILLVCFDLIHPLGLLSLITAIPAYKINRMICQCEKWQEFHNRGDKVRLFYLTNGIILIAAVALR